jgi:hypothetical protein
VLPTPDPRWPLPGQPQFPPPAQGGRTNGAAVGALIVGLVGILLAIILIGGLLGVVAIILGTLGLSKVKRVGSGRGMAITGIVTGILSIVISAMVMFGVFVFLQQQDPGLDDDLPIDIDIDEPMEEFD